MSTPSSSLTLIFSSSNVNYDMENRTPETITKKLSKAYANSIPFNSLLG